MLEGMDLTHKKGSLWRHIKFEKCLLPTGDFSWCTLDRWTLKVGRYLFCNFTSTRVPLWATTRDCDGVKRDLHPMSLLALPLVGTLVIGLGFLAWREMKIWQEQRHGEIVAQLRSEVPKLQTDIERLRVGLSTVKSGDISKVATQLERVRREMEPFLKMPPPTEEERWVIAAWKGTDKPCVASFSEDYPTATIHRVERVPVGKEAEELSLRHILRQPGFAGYSEFDSKDSCTLYRLYK
jgi:hypothetical protein